MAGKRTQQAVQRRHQSIMDVLSAQPSARVSTLAEQLDVSPLTIRRDLDELAAHGFVERRHGEARVTAAGRQLADQARQPFRAERDAIARAGAQLVGDGELVFINTSTTALSIIPYIAATDVNIVTNSSHADALPIPPGATVFVTGGEVRPPRGVLSGEFALANIRNTSATTAFVGCAGISQTAGITSTTQQEAMVNALMVERSKKLVLLADSGKINVAAGFSYAPLSRITTLITDTGAPAAEVDALIEAGVGEVMLVDAHSGARSVVGR